MPGREVRRNKRDASHGKTPSTSLKGVAGRSVKAWKNPEEKQKRGFPEPKLDGNPQRKNAAARYSPTPSRVQYHRRARP